MDVGTGTVTLRRIDVPSSTDDPDFRATVDIANAVDTELMGTSWLNTTYAEAWQLWQPTEYHTVVRLLAEVDDVVVGRAYLSLRLKEGLDTCWLVVEVLPQHRRRGVGGALLLRVEEVARDAGRSTFQTWAISPATSGALLAAETGFGGVAADASSTTFLLAAGYALEQVERISMLDLTAEHRTFEGALARAEHAAAPDYQLVTWRDRTPPERLDDVAWMHSRMSTDVPTGGLQVDEEIWDADRVREADERHSSDDRYLLTAAAEHVATGRLVAYTTLSVPVAHDRVAWQEDTLVTREHRGRRLGTLVKAANLRELAHQAPTLPAVFTWNAEENRPMLDVNEALGFRGVGYEGSWQRIDPSCAE